MTHPFICGLVAGCFLTWLAMSIERWRENRRPRHSPAENWPSYDAEDDKLAAAIVEEVLAQHPEIDAK